MRPVTALVAVSVRSLLEEAARSAGASHSAGAVPHAQHAAAVQHGLLGFHISPWRLHQWQHIPGQCHPLGVLGVPLARAAGCAGEQIISLSPL